jgi:hypothetical protein
MVVFQRREPFVGIPARGRKIVCVMALGARPVLGDEEA